MKMLAAAAAFVLAAVVPAYAEDMPIEHFAGRFTGEGRIQSGDGAETPIAGRQSEVEIAITDNGFSLYWNTLMVDEANPAEVKVKANLLEFARTDTPGVFRSTEQNDVWSGKPVTWAYIDNSTLFVSSVIIKEDGSYDVTTYARTVTNNDLDLVFTRVRDGEQVRRVTGRLSRVAE